MYAVLNRIRKKLPSHAIPHRELVLWAKGLYCDAEELFREERKSTPAATELLLSYDAFLKDFSLEEMSGSFAAWVKERRERIDKAARTVWGSAFLNEQSRGDWDRVFRLADHALHLDPGWEEAYCWFADACKREREVTPAAVERGRKLVELRRQRGESIQAATLKRFFEAQERLDQQLGGRDWINSRGEVAGALIEHGPELPFPTPAPVEVPRSVGVFLAAAMDALPDNAYRDHRIEVRAIADVIRLLPGCGSVFYAGETRGQRTQFTPPADALRENLEVLEQSQIFVMIYPQPLPSSTILEAGFALSMQKSTLILVHCDTQLPFLLREVSQVFPFAVVEEYNNADKLMEIIKTKIPQLLQQHARMVAVATS